MQGNGQTELTQALVGLVIPKSGRIRVEGQDVTALGTNDVLDLGVGYVPEDRLHDGLVGPFSIAENLVLDMYDQPPFARGVALNLREIAANADARVAEFDVRTPSAQLPASTLSGGNQQKVVLAREMSRPLKLLIVAQPTRGLDVGSMEFVHRRIVAERDRGRRGRADLDRAGRGAGPGRPHRGDVPRPDRRRGRARRRAPRRSAC